MASEFTQSERDYFILLSRELSTEQRKTIAIVLDAMAEIEEGFSPAELKEMASLMRGDFA